MVPAASPRRPARVAVVLFLSTWTLLLGAAAARRHLGGVLGYDVVLSFSPDAQAAPDAGPPPEMVLVPGGPAALGCAPGDPDCGDDERPPRRRELPPFEVDRTEVSAGAYAACVRAGTCPAPGRGERCNQGEARPGHPANCLRAVQAEAYCRFARKRLPSADEWEKAARGAEPRLYPWGAEPASCARAQLGGCGGDTRPVGSLAAGASALGVLDLAGNVWEWTTSSTADGRRVIKGGSWYDGPKTLRASNRGLAPPEAELEHVGFRCVRDLVER